MGFLSELFHSRDKPKDSLSGRLSFLFGGTSSGNTVTERTAMQTTAVYACVRVLAEAIAELPLNVFQYTEDGGNKSSRSIHYTSSCMMHRILK